MELQEYFASNHAAILKAASVYGAVMFRGFDLASPEDFASVLHKSGLKEVPYIGGAAVRKLIVGSEKAPIKRIQVVTTNESPPSEPIPFHHELAQTPFPPSHIAFYCQVAPEEGGSTPLIRSDLVLDYISTHHSETLAKFESLGVKYVRRVPQVDDPSSAIGRSWRSMFLTESREEAEEKMKASDYDFEWVPVEDGTVDCKVISKVLPAVRTSTNGKKAFHNQVLAAYTGWVDKRNEYGQAVRFGDGSEIPSIFIKDLEGYMSKNAFVYKWEPGMFVIVDNSVAYHSRQPFKGPRRIFAAIANGERELEHTQPAFALTSGDSMPAVGLGLWKIPNEQCEAVVFEAVKAGYRLLDSACDYGNEKEVGLGIKKALDAGVVSREQLWVTSKLWNTYHRKEHVREACLKTLADLGLQYLDLYLIHFPISLKHVPFAERYPPGWNYLSDKAGMVEDPVPLSETWRAMESLVKEGLVRNIGLCNVGTATLRDLLSYAEVKPTVLQVEMHPYLAQEKLLRFCRQKGIAVTAFSNLGAGSYVQLGMAAVEESCLNESAVQEIAKRHGRTPAQVVLRWGVQRGTAIIPKTTSKDRLKENLAVLEFTLSHEEMALIAKLDKNRRFNDPGVFCEAAFATFFPIYE